jgi:hypothetical protein
MSVSSCGLPGFALSGQLSTPLSTPSPSRSSGLTTVHCVVLALTGHGSQTSPTSSLSKSPCSPPSTGRIGLKTIMQLSLALTMPSPSRSAAVTSPV